MYSSWPAVAAPVLRQSDLGGKIMIVPVPKAVTIMSMLSNACLITFIFLNIVIDYQNIQALPH